MHSASDMSGMGANISTAESASGMPPMRKYCLNLPYLDGFALCANQPMIGSLMASQMRAMIMIAVTALSHVAAVASSNFAPSTSE